jgi:ketosteroid isomerase-like protein
MQTATISPVDTAAIRATIGPWTKNAVDRDWDAFLALCTDDAVFMPPDGPLVQGPALRPWLENYPIIKRFEEEFEQVEGQGDVAYARGRFQMTLEIDRNAVEVDGKFVDVLRRDPNGVWKYAVVIWNSNTPMAGD